MIYKIYFFVILGTRCLLETAANYHISGLKQSFVAFWSLGIAMDCEILARHQPLGWEVADYSASCVFPSHKTSQNVSVLRNKTQKPVGKTWKNSCHIIDINLDYRMIRMIRMDQIHMNSRYNPNSWAILGAPLRLSGGNCLWPLPAATRKPGKGLTQLWGNGWRWSIYRWFTVKNGDFP